MKHQTSQYSHLKAVVIILLVTSLFACQTQKDFSIPSSNPENAAINEVMTHQYEGFHIDSNSVRTVFKEEVGDWMLIGVRLTAKTQNNSGGPTEIVGCILLTKSTKKWMGWEATSADSICSVLNPQGTVESLTLSSGWVRGDNLLQQPQYNVVFGFLDPTMPKDVTITATWEDGEIIHLAPDQDVFIAVHPGPGQADYSKVEFFDANGKLISVYERGK